MEEGLNSYYSLAVDDLLYADTLFLALKNLNKFNGVASLCSQSAENFMKAFIESEYKDCDVNLLKSHNLKRLLKEIKLVEPSCSLSEKEYKWLGDFYFETRYPGDDFTIVTLEEAEDCLRLVKELKTWVDNNVHEKKENNLSGLKKLSELKDLGDE